MVGPLQTLIETERVVAGGTPQGREVSRENKGLDAIFNVTIGPVKNLLLSGVNTKVFIYKVFMK